MVAATGAYTLQRRLFSPVYQGSFQLLVQDPLSQERSSSGSSLDELVRSETSVDLETLIPVLTSPMLLDPIASQSGLASNALADLVSVSRVATRANGLLDVSLRWENPDKG